ncbi:DNA mismatch repair protein MSH6 [Carex littledalei]|uniref:DNA mismatch repair protein MSH6 n=1 Tax=Carex littledalei TaxID=544730 RepID=A0A833QSQ9_9POAL|nr:DNA mismatch repair protein MSH6 [Carex littledalei]
MLLEQGLREGGMGLILCLVCRRKEQSEHSKEVEEEEENAALMLCSFSDQRSGLNVLKPVNGVHMLSAVQEGNGLVGPCRVLRPRMREGFVRKKRRFYEVNLRDFNPVTIVKWRIRVYWPMDRSWYIGSVKEYDPVIHKHRVRYDDQEEEWLDLHNERFKLLLFPSDVPNKSNWSENNNPNLLSGENLEEDREEDSDATIEKIVETKPVKSLLTCSLYQLKPNPLPVTSNSNNFEVKANKSSVKNDRFLIVYSRKQFRNSKENLSSIGTILVDATRILPSHCDIVLKLNLPLALRDGF